jgi:hypothetical protein
VHLDHRRARGPVDDLRIRVLREGCIDGHRFLLRRLLRAAIANRCVLKRRLSTATKDREQREGGAGEALSAGGSPWPD